MAEQLPHYTKKDVAAARGMTSDNAYIEVIEDNNKLVAKLMHEAIAKALETVGILAEGHVIGWMTREKVVDTGRLRNSITHALQGDKSVAVGTNVEYGPYVHQGTSRMAARPFLTAPIQEHFDEYKGIIKKELGG